ncbi:hypothetical protein D3C73_1244050 [compost metagenome]
MLLQEGHPVCPPDIVRLLVSVMHQRDHAPDILRKALKLLQCGMDNARAFELAVMKD